MGKPPSMFYIYFQLLSSSNWNICDVCCSKCRVVASNIAFYARPVHSKLHNDLPKLHRWSKICAWSRHQYRLKMMASWSSRYSYKHLVMHWLQLFQHRCNFAASGLYWGSRRFYHFLSRLGSYKAWTHRPCGVVELFEEALKLFLPAGWISIEDKEK